MLRLLLSRPLPAPDVTGFAHDAHRWKRARSYPSVQINAMEPTVAKALCATLPCDIMRIACVDR